MDWLSTLGILFILVAIIFVIFGFISKIAWTIGKWINIIAILLAILPLIAGKPIF